MAPNVDDPRPTPRTLRRWLVRLLLIAGVLAGGYWVWAADPPQLHDVASEARRHWSALSSRLWQRYAPAPSARPAPVPVPVRAETVGRKDFPIILTGLGTVQAANMVTVRSRVDGQIVKVAFEEGQMLKEGDLLVQIDPAQYKAALDQATAKLAQDQASLANARQDLERTIPLAKQGISTQQLLDQRSATVASLTALVQADQAAIESARVQLAYTTIRAPLAGRAGFRLVDPGNIVQAADQTGMLTITQLQPISVVFTAPEQQLPVINEALKAGPLKVTAFSSDGERRLGEGTLRLVDNQVDVASGTIKLKASFPNPDNTLWPGLSVTTRLLLRTVRDAVVVPDSAVQRGPDGLYAYVVTADGKAELRPLDVARIADGMALVERGLAPGDRLVLAGHYRVQPGAAVDVIGNGDRPAAAAATPAADAAPVPEATPKAPPKPPPKASAPAGPTGKSPPGRKERRP